MCPQSMFLARLKIIFFFLIEKYDFFSLQDSLPNACTVCIMVTLNVLRSYIMRQLLSV